MCDGKIKVAEREQGREVIGVFCGEKQVFADSFFDLAVLEVNGGETLPRKAKVIFEFEAVLVKGNGVPFTAEPFTAMAQRVKRGYISGIAGIDQIQQLEGVGKAIIVQSHCCCGKVGIMRTGMKASVFVERSLEKDGIFCGSRFDDFFEPLGAGRVRIGKYLRGLSKP